MFLAKQYTLVPLQELPPSHQRCYIFAPVPHHDNYCFMQEKKVNINSIL